MPSQFRNSNCWEIEINIDKFAFRIKKKNTRKRSFAREIGNKVDRKHILRFHRMKK